MTVSPWAAHPWGPLVGDLVELGEDQGRGGRLQQGGEGRTPHHRLPGGDRGVDGCVDADPGDAEVGVGLPRDDNARR